MTLPYHSTRTVWARSLFIALLLWLLPVTGFAASSDATLEAQVKAAYLYNFTKFVDWPPQAYYAPNAPLVVGLMGVQADTAATIAEVLQSKRAPEGRFIEVRAISPGASAVGVHVLFVAASHAGELPRLTSELADHPVLLVGESTGFAQQGGAINFVVADNVVRFEVNLRRAQRAGLKLSGRLASVATLVRDDEPN